MTNEKTDTILILLFSVFIACMSMFSLLETRRLGKLNYNIQIENYRKQSLKLDSIIIELNTLRTKSDSLDSNVSLLLVDYLDSETLSLINGK